MIRRIVVIVDKAAVITAAVAVVTVGMYFLWQVVKLYKNI
jgi:hypothetical protein